LIIFFVFSVSIIISIFFVTRLRRGQIGQVATSSTIGLVSKFVNEKTQWSKPVLIHHQHKQQHQQQQQQQQQQQ
jgi:hypothetical protein